jgi:hypothetical protein
MLLGFILVSLFLPAFLAKEHVAADTLHLNGYYHMSIPDNGYQYVFYIDWSYYLERYVVTVTGQPLAWATATLEIVNDTAVNLVSDNGDTILGIIKYSTDLPSICWPTTSDFTCWNRLLSNVTRIHVINMYTFNARCPSFIC